MSVTPTVRIEGHDYAAAIAPATGGSLLWLTFAGQDLLRRAPDDGAAVLATASFALVPFANRIGHGRFCFDGAAVTLPASPQAMPHALHGHGWGRSWAILDQASDSVSIGYVHEADAWPWRYRASQRLHLTSQGLEIEIVVHNDDTRAMPIGVGIHPYFARFPDSGIVASARAMWRNDTTGLAVAREADRYFHDAKATVDALEGTDNFFEGQGEMIVTGGRLPVRMTADTMAGFHCYVPNDDDYFCVESVSHAPNSFGRGAFDRIEAGEERRWRYGIGVQPTRLAPPYGSSIITSGSPRVGMR